MLHHTHVLLLFIQYSTQYAVVSSPLFRPFHKKIQPVVYCICSYLQKRKNHTKKLKTISHVTHHDTSHTTPQSINQPTTMTVKQYSVFHNILSWTFLIIFVRDDVTTTVASAFVPSSTSSSLALDSFFPSAAGVAPSSSSFCQQQQQERYKKRNIWLYCNDNDADTIKIDTRRSVGTLLAKNQQQQQEQQQEQNRRTFFRRTATGGVVALLSANSYSLVANSASTSLPTIPMQNQQGKDNGGDSTRPICIIGANGKTGSECVGACLARGIPVVATTRGGVYTGNYANASSDLLIGNAICDVTLPDTIMDAIKGSRAVIFAASASKAGGTPAAVDNLGLVNVAKACIDQKIPHLVIVSSGAVTKPESPVYKFLNLFGNIMEEKIRGEDRVRNMYQKEFSQGITVSGTTTYTILRPGGLTEESVRGVQALELNQGDTKSGRISRADVASLCVEVTKYPAITGGTTFECYDADTGKPLQTVGISNLFKQKNNMNLGQKGASSNVDVYISGYEQRGSTWEDLFTGLTKDVDVNEIIS